MDIDGIVYDWFGIYRFLANYHLGVDLPPVEEIWDGEKTDADFLTREQWAWLWEGGVKCGLFRYGHILKGSVEALREISSFADVVVITHRPTSWNIEVSEEARRKGIKDTIAWLALLSEDVQFVETHILDKGVPKSSIVCDAYLDDGAHVIEDLRGNSAPGTLIMLWTRPWNRKVECDGRRVVRIASWSEVLRLVRQKSISF